MSCSQLVIVGKSMRCKLIGMSIYPPPGSPNNPCQSCEAEWQDGKEPCEGQLTPTIEKRKQGQPTFQETKGGGNVPERCAHFLKILVPGCCANRVYSCEKHGSVKLIDCQRCKDYEDDF